MRSGLVPSSSCHSFFCHACGYGCGHDHDHDCDCSRLYHRRLSVFFPAQGRSRSRRMMSLRKIRRWTRRLSWVGGKCSILWSFSFPVLRCQRRPLPTAPIFHSSCSLLVAAILSAHSVLSVVDLSVWLFAMPAAPARRALATATWRKVLRNLVLSCVIVCSRFISNARVKVRLIAWNLNALSCRTEKSLAWRG